MGHMKTFHRPEGAWLSEQAFSALQREYTELWNRIEDLRATSPWNYPALQNQAMLLKFFLEQAFGSGDPPRGDTLRVLERDFGGIEGFAVLWHEAAARAGVDWLVLGLSFADFRFHLFPVGSGSPPIPFCVSPIFCACMRGDVVERSGLSRDGFARAQWEHLGWSAVEDRLVCLTLPLDVFDEPADCVTESCAAESLAVGASDVA
jgi:superoxide dismutase